MAGGPDDDSSVETTGSSGTSTGRVNVQDFLQMLLSHHQLVVGKVTSDGKVEFEFRTRSCACSRSPAAGGGGASTSAGPTTSEYIDAMELIPKGRAPTDHINDVVHDASSKKKHRDRRSSGSPPARSAQKGFPGMFLQG